MRYGCSKGPFQTFLVDSFLSGKKPGSNVITRAKGNKIVALLKGTCNDSDHHLGKVTQIFPNALSCAWSVGCALLACQKKGEH